ncbi:YSIRK-type signal peptide-containing protein, partial [Clostridium perfringens]
MEAIKQKRLKPNEPSKKNPKYKLRKLSVGVVSFLAGFTVFYGGAVAVSAKEISPQDVGVVIEQSVNENRGIPPKEQNQESASTGGDTTTKTDKFSKEQKEEKEKRVESNENIKAETSNGVEANGLSEKSVDSKDAVSDANSTINTEDNKEASKNEIKDTLDNTEPSKSSKTETKSNTDKSNRTSMIVDRSDEGKPLKEGTRFYGDDKTVIGTVPNTEGRSVVANVPVEVPVTVSNEATLQLLGGWTDVNSATLSNNLGNPASNQGNGKVIEYSTNEWNASDNHNIFGWKTINGRKIAFSANGLGEKSVDSKDTVSDANITINTVDNKKASTNEIKDTVDNTEPSKSSKAETKSTTYKSNWPSMIADRSDEGKPLKEGSRLLTPLGNIEIQPGGSVGESYPTPAWPKPGIIPAPDSTTSSATETTAATETVQPLGGWTNPRMGILPDNLGETLAPNSIGKVIEYTSEKFDQSLNKEQFGWKPISTKVGISKSGLNALARPQINYQDGFIPNSQNRNDSGNNNSLILANYAEQSNYQGVYRLVDVTDQKELSWKASYTGYNYPNNVGEKFKIIFYNNDGMNKVKLNEKVIDTNLINGATGVMMIPKGTKTIRVELVPLYNNNNIWNQLNLYGVNKEQYRYNVLVNGFELYKTSNMKDALPEDEKIQIFRNGTSGKYNFTVKNASPQEAGTNGGAQISPYLTNINNTGTPIEALKSGVDLKFEDKLPNGVASDYKPTLFANGMNSQTSQLQSGGMQKLELKTIDLTKIRLERPQVINVDAYKLNYSTEAKLYRSIYNVNNYIRREYTLDNTPYHQDVVANNEKAASTYGNALTNKRVGDLATGRSIIILMDKTALEEVVNREKAKTLNQVDYTTEAWDRYQKALDKAKKILEENETLDNLKVDTETKLNTMASQKDIDDLTALLPTILVKAPTIAGGDNGSVTSTPNEDTVKMTVKYKDGKKDITVEVTKMENPKTSPDEAPTYSWNITGVDTVEGSTPAVHSNDAPTGVTVDSATGKVTIAKANVSDGTNVTASDISISNQASKEVTVVKPNAPTVTATDKNTVTVAPPKDENLKSLIVSYTDDKNAVQTVTVTKSEENTWAVEGDNHGVTVDESTGVVTIPDSLIKADTDVTAKAKGIANLESSDASITRLSYAQ